jgi:hypothetical protein
MPLCLRAYSLLCKMSALPPIEDIPGGDEHVCAKRGHHVVPTASILPRLVTRSTMKQLPLPDTLNRSEYAFTISNASQVGDEIGP